MAQEKKAFDLAVCDKLRECFQGIFLSHPEVRSLACTVDWTGDLNDAKVQHGVWLGDGGPVTSLDAIVGSVEQTIKMLSVQLDRAVTFHTHLREQIGILGVEVTAKHEEKQRLEKEIAGLKAEKEGLQGA